MDTVNTVILGIFALLGIVGALVGFSKGLIRSVVKVASIILAIVVAFFITPTLLAKAYELVSPQLDGLFISFEELFVASPTLKEHLPTLVMALLSPVVFIAVFAVCLFAVAIVRGILNVILKAVLPKPGLITRLCGLALGAVGGVLVALCFVFPITGYFTAVPQIYANVSEIISTEENPIPENVEQFIFQLPSISNAQKVNDTTKQYFDKLVSYNNGEEMVSALDDLTTITSIIPPALRFAKSVDNVETMDTQAIKDINAIIGSNKKLRTIVAEILSVASQKWLDDQPFMGFNLKAQLPEEYKFALDFVLDDLSQTTEATVVDDLNSLVNTMDTVKHLYAYATLLKSGNATMEQLDEKLTEVLTSLNDDTVDLLHQVVSSDVMEEIGVQNPELVAELVTDVIDSAVNNLDESQTAEDAAAINSVMHFAANDGSITAKQVVEDIVHSPAIAEAIAKVVSVEDHPVITVLPEQKALIIEALLDIEDPQLVENLKKLFDI